MSLEDSEIEYEPLEMYAFGISYPSTWEVELEPHSTASMGDLAFKTRGTRVFLSWGPLEEKRKQFASLDSQVEDSFKRMKKGPDVRKLELLDRKEMKINGHRSICSSARLTLGVGLMAMKTARREVCSIHFYCDPSRKFFALYAEAMRENAFSNFIDILLHMSSTLRCHD